MSSDHIVILILLLALVAKFVIFENKGELRTEEGKNYYANYKLGNGVLNGLGTKGDASALLRPTFVFSGELQTELHDVFDDASNCR